MVRRSTLLLSIFLLFSSSGLSQPILSLRVEGNRNTDSSLITSTSGIQVAEELSLDEIQRAIKNIYNTGLFSDVKVNVEEEDGGVRLIFIVKEHPTLSELKIVGSEKISAHDLREEVKPVSGEILSPQKVFNWKRKIVNKYKEKGHLLIEVEDVISEPDENGRVGLTFRISEGRRVRIRKIEVVGNKAFSDKAIELKLKNREKTWYRSGNFDEAEFYEDLNRIEGFYMKRGFADARVEDYRVEYDKRKEWMSVFITVDEGRRYRIGRVAFRFPEQTEQVTGEGTSNEDPLFPEEKLRTYLKFGTGDVYNREKIEQSTLSFYELYSEEGRIYCQIEPQESRRDTLIDVNYFVRQGEPAYVRKIRIGGNEKTWEKVIRRELHIYPGDLFRRSKVVKSQRAVYNLGFFEDVRLDYEPLPEGPGKIDLIFEVKEKPTGQVSAGAGYSQTDGLTGNLSLSIPNIMGRGQSAYFRLEKGGRVQNIELGFTEPWLFDTPTSAGFDIFHITRRWYEAQYREQRKGFDLRLSRPIPRLEYTRLYWMYKLEDIRLFDFSPEYEPGAGYLDLREERWPKRSSSTRVTLVRDSRDNVFNATMGTRNSISSQFAGGLLGGEAHFQRYEAETRWYGETVGKFVLMLRARAGLIDEYGESSPFLEIERFRVGGVGDWGVRGYPDRSIGPSVGTRVIGGRTALVLTLEHKLPLAKNVYWITFLDAGNAWESFQESQPADLKTGVGTGIRIEVPMLGIIGFDMGYGIEPRSWEPHFQLGTSF